ncbi:hypothetical protein AcW1_008509 [Taiwanofungus camphoratus]|nr:hypothetical protein AcW1_008509 [Antrodia cinnamomea]
MGERGRVDRLCTDELAIHPAAAWVRGSRAAWIQIVFGSDSSGVPQDRRTGRIDSAAISNQAKMIRLDERSRGPKRDSPAGQDFLLNPPSRTSASQVRAVLYSASHPPLSDPLSLPLILSHVV